MTITNIMRVTGTRTDLYSPSYFKKDCGNWQRPAVNPFKRWIDGKLFAFGTVINQLGEDRVVIDLSAAKDELNITADSDDPFSEIERCLTDNETLAKQFIVESPVIPPSVSYTNWEYKHVVDTHQYHTWVVDKWQPVSMTEITFMKRGDDMTYSPVERKVSTDTVSQPYKIYYYINKYDFKNPTAVTLCYKAGVDIAREREILKQYFLSKYTISEEEATVEVLESDYTQADYYDRDTEKNASLMGFWLGKLKSSLRILSVDQNPNVVATYGNHTDRDTNMVGDFEYRHALPDAVFEFTKPIVSRTSTVPICNGLFFYPVVKNDKLFAVEGQRLSYNERDRNRRWVLMDFSPVGGAQFVPLKDLRGPLSEMIIPKQDGVSIIDTSKQSVLLVVRGRLYLPTEFEIINNEYILFDITKYNAVHELDRMICRGDFRWNSNVLEQRAYSKEVVMSRRSETIHAYKPTSDTIFQEGKKYFVELCGDFIEVDSSSLVGNIVSKDVLYKVGVYDHDKIHTNMMHDSDGQIYFNVFYEYVEDTIINYSRDIMVETHCKSINLKHDPNSFLIIINKPQMRVISHDCISGPWPMTKMAWGTDVKTGTMKVDFDRQVRGLLFDNQTRSVIDYTRETQSLTFYADKSRKWGIANTSANWSSLLAVTDESAHNSMISRGFVLDDCNTDKYDHIVWPKLSVLDFVFRD